MKKPVYYVFLLAAALFVSRCSDSEQKLAEEKRIADQRAADDKKALEKKVALYRNLNMELDSLKGYFSKQKAPVKELFQPNKEKAELHLFGKRKPATLSAESFAQMILDIIDDSTADFEEAEIELATSYTASADFSAGVIITYSLDAEYERTSTTNFHFTKDTSAKDSMQTVDRELELFRKKTRENINATELASAIKNADRLNTILQGIGNGKYKVDTYSVKLEFALTYTQELGFKLKFLGEKLGAEGDLSYSNSASHSIYIKFANRAKKVQSKPILMKAIAGRFFIPNY